MSDKQDATHDPGNVIQKNNDDLEKNGEAMKVQGGEGENSSVRGESSQAGKNVSLSKPEDENPESTSGSTAKEAEGQSGSNTMEPEESEDGYQEYEDDDNRYYDPDEEYDEAPDEQPAKPAGWAALFNGCAKCGPLILLLALGCMVWPDFWETAKAWYCPPEARTIGGFLHGLAQQSWLAPVALENGAWSVPQWPVFYWLLGLLAFIPGIMEMNFLYPAAATVAAFLGIMGVWCLAHSAKFGSRAAFAGGVILLCAPLFTPLPHFIGCAPLAAALEVIAIAHFCAGWQKTRAFFRLPAAFVFTSLAALCGGFYLLIVPLGASFLYLIWCGNFRRAQRFDALLGFVLMLVIICGWMGMVMMTGANEDYLPALYGGEWNFTWPLHKLWWLPLVIAAIGALPWLLMVLGVSWFRVLARSLSTLRASRHENGSALVWLSLVLACCLAPFITNIHLAAITILFILVALLGKAFVNLSGVGNRFFFLLAALCLIIAGLALLAASYSPSQSLLVDLLGRLSYTPDPALMKMCLSLNTLPILGGICVLGGLLALFFVRKNAQGGGLVYGLLLTIILCQPALLMLVPELGARPDAGLVQLAAIEKSVEKALPAVKADTETPAEAVPPDPENAKSSTSVTPQTENSSDAAEPVKNSETSVGESAQTPPVVEKSAPAPAQPEAAPEQQTANPQTAAPAPQETAVEESGTTPPAGSSNAEQAPTAEGSNSAHANEEIVIIETAPAPVNTEEAEKSTENNNEVNPAN